MKKSAGDNAALLERVPVARYDIEVLIEAMEKGIEFVDALDDLHTSENCSKVHPLTKGAATEAMAREARCTLGDAIERAKGLAALGSAK